jgi:hypothetical protein
MYTSGYFFRGIFFSILLSLLILTGCQKEEELNKDFDRQSSELFSTEEMLENAFEVVESLTFSGLMYATEHGGRVAQDAELACANISLSTTQKPAGKVTIDFGSGCTGVDGKTRKGKVIVHYSGNWLVKGTVVTTTLEGFSINGVKVEGTRTLTNKNYNIDSKVIQYEVNIADGKIIWPNGAYATRTVHRLHDLKFEASMAQSTLCITGTASGVTEGGVAYATEITEPLIFKSACKELDNYYFPVTGKKTVTLPAKPNTNPVLVDYGSGDCDAQFTISVGALSASVTLDDIRK